MSLGSWRDLPGGVKRTASIVVHLPPPLPLLAPIPHMCHTGPRERDGGFSFPLFVFTKHPLQPCMNTFAAMRCVSWTRAGEVQEWKSFPPSTPQRFPFPKDSVPFSRPKPCKPTEDCSELLLIQNPPKGLFVVASNTLNFHLPVPF